MNKHWSTLLACLLLGGASAQADQAFRDHRYDGFKVLSANKEQIVFIGNSITTVSYTHLTLPTITWKCRSRWSPYH